MTEAINAPAAGTCSAGIDVEQLTLRALTGLIPMFDPQSQLFGFKLNRSASGFIREGLSHRYTMMTLLGLQRAESAGLKSPVGIRQVLEGLLHDLTWIQNIGDLGLLLWTVAKISPQRLCEIWSRTDPGYVFRHSQAVREGRTMELAWFLSGLAHALLSGMPAGIQDVPDLAHEACGLLCLNQGNQGFFGHLGRSKTLLGRLRARIGSFADQAYPIYALSKFFQACRAPLALEAARKCGDAICRVQGTLGQWWWHYDAPTGRVVERYPVYSVHQEGMAPMALFALEEVSHLSYSKSIHKGLAWISGINEIDSDLRDATGVVWRCLRYRSSYKKYLDRIAGSLGLQAKKNPGRELSILFECRPYELGWLLYALAGRRTSAA